MLILLAEVQLAGKCTKGIHGTSNLVRLLRNSMAEEHGLDNIKMIQIDYESKHVRKDPKEFLENLEVQLQTARNLQKA